MPHRGPGAVLTTVLLGVAASATAVALLSAWRLTHSVAEARTLFEVLTEVANEVLARPERAAMVELCLGASHHPPTRRRLLDLADAMRGHFPGCQVDINLLGPEDNTRLCCDPDEPVPVDPVVPCMSSYCAFTLVGGKLHQVNDSRKDPRLQASPYVEEVRSYLGCPFSVGSQDVGVVCVYHPQPRLEWTATERRLVHDFATAVAAVFDDALTTERPDQEGQ